MLPPGKLHASSNMSPLYCMILVYTNKLECPTVFFKTFTLSGSRCREYLLQIMQLLGSTKSDPAMCLQKEESLYWLTREHARSQRLFRSTVDIMHAKATKFSYISIDISHAGTPDPGAEDFSAVGCGAGECRSAEPTAQELFYLNNTHFF